MQYDNRYYYPEIECKIGLGLEIIGIYGPKMAIWQILDFFYQRLSFWNSIQLKFYLESVGYFNILHVKFHGFNSLLRGWIIEKMSKKLHFLNFFSL